jgi:hypothetical protein
MLKIEHLLEGLLLCTFKAKEKQSVLGVKVYENSGDFAAIYTFW